MTEREAARERRARLRDIDTVAMRLPQVERSTSEDGRHSCTVAGKGFVLFCGPRRLAQQWLADRGESG